MHLYICNVSILCSLCHCNLVAYELSTINEREVDRRILLQIQRKQSLQSFAIIGALTLRYTAQVQNDEECVKFH